MCAQSSTVALCFLFAARLCWIRSGGWLCEVHLWLCRRLWRHDGWMQMCVFAHFKCYTVIAKEYAQYNVHNVNIGNNLRCMRSSLPPTVAGWKMCFGQPLHTCKVSNWSSGPYVISMHDINKNNKRPTIIYIWIYCYVVLPHCRLLGLSWRHHLFFSSFLSSQ